MKIKVEVVDTIEEDEVIIRCGSMNENIQKIHQYLLEQSKSSQKITFFKENQEYYFPLHEVLFFETEGTYIYAHTRDDTYRIKYRLYELEQMLSKHFIRVSKSAIVNLAHIYSINRNLTSSSLIQFRNSHKQIYASRYYYKNLRDRLNERSL